MTWRTSDYDRLRHSLALANAIDRLGEEEARIEAMLGSGDTLPPVPTNVTAVTHSPDRRECDERHVTNVTQEDLTWTSGDRVGWGRTHKEGHMDTQDTQALRVEGLTVTVQADALREAVATIVAKYLADNSPTQVDDDHITSIVESVMEDKMPSGYDDPTDHYDMSDYVTTSNVEDYVSQALSDDDSLAHGDDLRETDENVADLTERVAKLEARWTALIVALTGTAQVQEVA